MVERRKLVKRETGTVRFRGGCETTSFGIPGRGWTSKTGWTGGTYSFGD